jgi:DNA-directed RNA polymerase specialized sigma24 family protein
MTGGFVRSSGVGAVTFRSVRGPVGRHAVPRMGSDLAGDELARLYAEYSRSLLQLAALLVPDIGAAREVMYEAFAALARGRSYPRGGDAFAFLLRAVVHRARTAAPAAGPSETAETLPIAGAAATCEADMGAAEAALPQAAVLHALRALPGPQREALVLRYYGQLSDEEAAAAMGVRPAELRANVARGMAELRAMLASAGREPT